jgi:hypothetical protein
LYWQSDTCALQLAMLLFAMARCGNFVTLWTLIKLGKYQLLCAFSLLPWASSVFLHFSKHTQKARSSEIPKPFIGWRETE